MNKITVSAIFCIIILLSIVFVATADIGEPYGLINAVKTECEYQGLLLGTRLSDAFNSYDESVPYYRRLHHRTHLSNAAFSKIIHIETLHHHLPHLSTSNNKENSRRLSAHGHGHGHGHKVLFI